MPGVARIARKSFIYGLCRDFRESPPPVIAGPRQCAQKKI
jgi:hypothetical protein